MIAAPAHTLFACPQCWAAVNEPDGREPDGLCQTGRDLYDAAAEWAGRAMATGRWAAYDAAEDAYHAHVTGEDMPLTGATTCATMRVTENTAAPGGVLAPAGRLDRDLSRPGGDL